MNQDVSSPSAMKSVDDAAPVPMEGAERAIRREEVVDCRGEAPDGGIKVRGEAADEVDCALGERGLRVGGGDGGGVDVGDCVVAALYVLCEGEDFDGEGYGGGFFFFGGGGGGGGEGWFDGGEVWVLSCAHGDGFLVG